MSLALFDSVVLSMLLSSQTTQKSGTEMWGQEHEKPKGRCFLLVVCPLPKLHSFYLRHFKSFWLNTWTPPIKMPSRFPHKCITHTYMNGHLWSAQMSDGIEPWPFRMSQVGKKAACIFLISLHEHVKGYSRATAKICWSFLVFLCRAIFVKVPAQSLHVTPGIHLYISFMRIIIWDGALWVWCLFAEFPVLLNVRCRMLACF